LLQIVRSLVPRFAIRAKTSFRPPKKKWNDRVGKDLSRPLPPAEAIWQVIQQQANRLRETVDSVELWR
jgi:hypothetical protein